MLGLIVSIVAVANLVAAALFAYDKRAAVAEWRRVPERTLLGAAALGAGPLLLVLSGWLRHKTRKQPFRMRLIAIAIIEVTMLAILLVDWMI